MSTQTIGFIGLGNMGLPMASNLAAAGHNVLGFDPALLTSQQPDNSNLSIEKLHLKNSLSEAVNDCDIVLLMLPNGHVVLDVLQQIIDARAHPKAIVDCSTIDIEHARQAHVLAQEAGLEFMDAPVSGGIAGAAAGTLTTMIGGNAELLKTLKPVLQPMFKTFVHCGNAGAGQAAKICNNMLLATAMIGTAETFNLGEKLGLAPEILFNVLSTSTGSCWPVNSYCPVPGVGPVSPADNNYQPGFSAHMMLKDMNLTQSAAQSVAQATPLGAKALALYDDYVNDGGGDNDFSGIIRYIEKLGRE